MSQVRVAPAVSMNVAVPGRGLDVRDRCLMRSRSVLSCMALATLLLSVIAAPAAATASGGDTGTFSCTASALRVTLLAATIEPIVANPADAPCADDSQGLVGPIAVGSVVINGVATADTAATPGGGHADSGVTEIAVGPGIAAEVLTSSADVSCKDGQPSFSSAGEVVNLRIGGTVVAIPADQGAVTLDILGIGTLYLNEVVTTSTSITRRALRLDTALVDVVIAESKADVEGTPCEAKPPPQCSDDEDNDGDKMIDKADPQCHEDGDPKNDKSYDSSDDDESK